jgi:hypothetical protein
MGIKAGFTLHNSPVYASPFPLTVPMVDFGGREYYGGISQRPVNTGKTQRSFINGDITYCAQNNTLAIFYAQTDRPNLGMDVIPIGRLFLTCPSLTPLSAGWILRFRSGRDSD